MRVKTKYNLGDKVWFIAKNKVQCLKVTYIYINAMEPNGFGDNVCISYALQHGDARIDEELLYASKEELLKTL